MTPDEVVTGGVGDCAAQAGAVVTTPATSTALAINPDR